MKSQRRKFLSGEKEGRVGEGVKKGTLIRIENFSPGLKCKVIKSSPISFFQCPISSHISYVLLPISAHKKTHLVLPRRDFKPIRF